MSEADAEISACIKARKSFLLDAGAGSGKTYSLVLALKEILGEQSRELARNGPQVACITFTNVAKDEIIERVGETSLVRVSTIHDFLWDMIGPHQKALRAALLKFNAGLKANSTRKVDQAELEAALPTVQISYSEVGTRFLEGRLFHDDLVGVAQHVFSDNSLLGRVVAAKHPIIFIDEYQDTSAAVIDIVLGSILPKNSGSLVLGFFGDKLQNIYHGGEHPGVGEIPAPLAGQLHAIQKGENRRCSKAVIEVLNRIRTDIQQFPSADNVEGDAVFVQIDAADLDTALGQVRAYLHDKRGWLPAGVGERELYLTHRVISRKGGYAELLAAFATRGGFYRDEFLSGEDRRIGFFIDGVEPLAAAWMTNNVGQALTILRNGGYRLANNNGKRDAKAALDRLLELRASGTVRDVLEHVCDTKLLPLIDDFIQWLKGPPPAPPPEDVEAVERAGRDKIFYETILGLPYAQVASYVEFFEEHTPFATKHGVKGTEFNTVFVVLDDKGANWNLYSFNKYLSGEDLKTNPERWGKTRNVFYVCCSRAKQNLAIIDLGGRTAAKSTAVEAMFGGQNVIQL